MAYIAAIAALFGLELWIKNRVERNRREERDTAVLGGALILRKHHNRGAFLNFGEKKRWIVAAFSVAFTIGLSIVFLVTLTGRGSRMLRIGLTLMLGGAYSNTYDRLKRKYVVDYFSLGFCGKRVRNIIFNIGDFCIMAGAMLMVIGGSCEQ